jgi:hypothetical protein
MYSITKLKKESQDFIMSLTTGNKSRSVTTSIALGKVIADRLSLPSGEVENIAAYYRTSSTADFNSLLSEINELVILDITAVTDYAAKFYMNRYYNAFPAPVTIALKPETAVTDFFSIGRSFDKCTLDTIQEHCVCLTDQVSKFKILIGELRGSEEVVEATGEVDGLE